MLPQSLPRVTAQNRHLRQTQHPPPPDPQPGAAPAGSPAGTPPSRPTELHPEPPIPPPCCPGSPLPDPGRGWHLTMARPMQQSSPGDRTSEGPGLCMNSPSLGVTTATVTQIYQEKVKTI